MKYRKKSVVIEAFRLTDDTEMTATKWFTQAVAEETVWIDRSIVDGHTRVYGCTISTLEGRMYAKLGDYIIRGVSGELYPCKPDIFKKLMNWWREVKLWYAKEKAERKGSSEEVIHHLPSRRGVMRLIFMLQTR